eukprot:1224526-Prymnesium_polylepis.1
MVFGSSLAERKRGRGPTSYLTPWRTAAARIAAKKWHVMAVRETAFNKPLQLYKVKLSGT